jgi:hypothetical protein
MADNRAEQHPGADATLDHMLEEVREMEGVGSKAKWFKAAGFVVVLAAVVAIVWYAQQRPVDRPVIVDEGVQFSLSEPQMGRLMQKPTYFKWQSVSGRAQYVLRIGTDAGQADILEKYLKKDSVSLTEAEAANLTPGRTYHVKVWALDKAGKKIGHAEGKFDL